MTVCWYKNNILIKSCIKVKSESNKTLWKNFTIIKDFDDDDINNNFMCVATNAYGKANDSYTVPCHEGNIFW